MAWKGGFKEVVDRAKFIEHVDGLKVPSWVKGLTLHHTAAPYVDPPVPELQRLKNLENYYKNEKGWSGGPHMYVWPKLIGLGTPLTQKTVHSVAFNSGYWSLEMEGFYDKNRDHYTSEKGQQVIDGAAFAFAVLLRKANLEANNTTIKFHREDPKAHKTCPGSAIDKAEFIARVKNYMAKLSGQPVVEEVEKNVEDVPVVEIGTAKEIQERLIAWGYDLGSAGADGVIGPITKAAIQEFQKKMGVTTTGVVGKWLWKKLQETPTVVKEEPKPEPVDPDAPFDPNKLKGKDRPLYVKKVLMSLGWTDFQAAAMVGNLMRESYPDLRSNVWGDWMIGKKIVPAGTKGAAPTAFGIGQWRGSRLEHLKNFAESNKKHIEDLDVQARFVDWELRNTEKVAGKMLVASTNLVEALRAGISFERPKGWTLKNPENGDGWAARMKFAQSLL